jgi:hypothetical protein
MQVKIMIYDRNKIPLGFQWLSTGTPAPIYSLWKQRNAEWFMILIEGDPGEPTVPSQF